jgi:hypothetical protein
MLRIVTLLSFLILSSVSHAQSGTRKVLFIGIDGCRWDALQAADAPNLDNLLNNSVYSSNGLTEYQTWSGTGWSNMLTGVWHTKHGVTNNAFTAPNFSNYPDFLSRVEAYNPALKTFSVVHWAPLNTQIIQTADQEITLTTDIDVKDAAVDLLAIDNPDVLFVAFDDVDHAGHGFGFSPQVPEYIESIEITDAYIGELMTALQNRSNYANEDWLVIVTTDHGGNLAGHGGGTLDERSIFNVFHNDNFTAQEISRETFVNPTTFNEAQFDAGTFAQPANQAAFEFGATQDFTIELWIKAESYTGDPSFISNKNWDSGLNPGFVISANGGQFWKINIGDGVDRLDIQGGFIAPSEWHHLAVSFDRDGLITAYEDGVIVGFEKMENIGDINSNLPLVINQDGTTTYGYDFAGSYRDIRVWNAALTGDVISQWAALPVNASHPNFNNLIANWKCEDGSGNSLTDSSPNNNNAAVTGNLNWNNDHIHIFTVYDYSLTTRQPDNAVTALDWMCVPLDESWGLDGKSWVNSCLVTAKGSELILTGFSVQPNPASNYLTLNLDFPNTKSMDLFVYNTEGKLIKQLYIPSNHQQLDISISDFPSGLYFLKVSDGKLSSTKIILKEN